MGNDTHDSLMKPITKPAYDLYNSLMRYESETMSLPIIDVEDIVRTKRSSYGGLLESVMDTLQKQVSDNRRKLFQGWKFYESQKTERL